MPQPSTSAPSPALQELQAPRFSKRGLGALWAICLLGLVLRLWLQKDRAFEGDELGSLRFIEESYTHILTTFRDQLTMNYYLIVLKALAETLGKSPWVLVAPSVLAGVGTIWLVGALALRLGNQRLALTSAILVAANPCLIEFSLRIRSYMLLVALSTGAILCFYDWSRQRGWRHGIRCGLWSLAALLMHPNALYQMSFLIVMIGIELWRDRRQALSFLVPMGLAAVLTALAYLPIQEDMAIFRERWTLNAPSEWGYLPDSMRLFFVGQGWILASLALFGMGLWIASQESRQLSKFGLAILVPMVVTSLMGVSHYPWTYARFLMPILPVMLVFIALALTHLSRRSNLGLVLLTGMLCFTWWPRLEKVFREQREAPYGPLAEHISALQLSEPSLYCFDPVLRGRLLPYLGEELFCELGPFVRSSAAEQPAALFVLTEKQALETQASFERFGKLRLYRFDAHNKRAAAHQLFEATGKAFVDEPIAPARLAVYYQGLMQMAQIFQNDLLELEYTRLYHLTERYQKKHRQMPAQLRSPAMLNN